MSEIDLKMPGGPYPYPVVHEDEVYMSNLADMQKQFENAGQIVNGGPVPPQQASLPVPPAPAPAEVMPQPPQEPVQELGQPIPAPGQVPPPASAKKPAAKKQAVKPTVPAPAPVEQAPAVPSTLDTLKSNFAADIENLQSDWADLLKIATAKPEVDAEEVEKLKAEIDSLKTQNAALEAENQKLKAKIQKLITDFVES